MTGLALAVSGVVIGSGIVSADTPGEDGYDGVYLLQDCAAAGKNLGPSLDCFETVTDLNDFIWGPGGRNPGPEDPLVVDIGVGEFEGTLVCNGGGHVTFRGVGRERSRLVGNVGGFQIGLLATDCDALEFQDLTIRSGHFGVLWVGSGTSTWTDARVDGDLVGWDSYGCNAGESSEHRFFGSEVSSNGLYGHLAFCGTHRFYGSEIEMNGGSTFASNARVGVSTSGLADVRLFGSSIQSLPAPDYVENGDFVGVQLFESAGGGGSFHMHGGSIVVDAGATGDDAIGIDAQDPSSLANTVGTSFELTAGTGEAIRLDGMGTIQSPLLWHSGTDEPMGGVLSQTGKDMFVEIDCDEVGCNGGGTEPHLMIYSDACGADPWFDTVRVACRS